ncbi:MAG: hypothetical protein R3B13_11875 [Polyangiaceae bacterium]
MKTSSPLYLSFGILGFVVGCGGSTLEPVQDGTGGKAGSSGSGGSGNATGTGGSGNAAGAGGTGSAGATGGTGGTGGSVPCGDPNPAGCVQTGCDTGFICNTEVTACAPSGCTCDSKTKQWACLPDCGGGVCTPDPKQSKYFVRIGFHDGQVKIPDVCVAYGKYFEAPGYAFEEVGLLEQNGETAESLNRFQRLTKYLPLKQQPMAFGIKSFKDGCSAPTAVSVVDTATPSSGFYTWLSVPYSGEAPVSWVLNDAPPTSGSINGSLRVANVAVASQDLINASADGTGLGTIGFADQGPKGYAATPAAHLDSLTFEHGGQKYKASYVGFDLLPVQSTTIFVASKPDFSGLNAIGCVDARTDTFCFTTQAKIVP